MLTIDGIQYPNASVTIATNQPTAPPVVPPIPPPAPPAPPVQPPAGWTLQMNPITYENVVGPNAPMVFDINTQLTYKFRALANQINVHPIRFDPAFYTGTRGVISHAITSSNANSRDYWISNAPGGPPVTFYCRAMNQGLAGVMVAYFDGTLGACNLTKGVQYYLNVKASSTGTTVDYLLNATPL